MCCLHFWSQKPCFQFDHCYLCVKDLPIHFKRRKPRYNIQKITIHQEKHFRLLCLWVFLFLFHSHSFASVNRLPNFAFFSRLLTAWSKDRCLEGVTCTAHVSLPPQFFQAVLACSNNTTKNVQRARVTCAWGLLITSRFYSWCSTHTRARAHTHTHTHTILILLVASSTPYSTSSDTPSLHLIILISPRLRSVSDIKSQMGEAPRAFFYLCLSRIHILICFASRSVVDVTHARRTEFC